VILAFPPALFGAPRVSITLPELDPALTSLAAELAVEGARFVDDVNFDLEDLSVDRPLLMGEFGIAAARAPAVRYAMPGFTFPEITFGVDAVARAHPLDDSVGSLVSGMSVSTDERVGAAAEPFVVIVRFPLPLLGPDGYAGASLGLMRLDVREVSLKSFSFGASLGRRFAGFSRGAFRWNGVSVEGGVDFAWKTIGARYSPGTVERAMTLDADGSGPLAPFSSTFSVDPDVLVSLETRVAALTVAASTGITLVEAFSLSAGVGFTVSGSRSELSVYSSDAVDISGQLATLTRSECRITVSGPICSGGGMSSDLYYQACARFGAGALSLSVPVIWTPRRMFGVGLYAGVDL
jgi:hypothetical protein